jgi:hypothetical protein
MKLRQIVLMVLMLVGLQLVVAPMRACSDDFPDPVISDQINGADLVLVGTVTGSSSDDPYLANYVIQVEWYLKGSGPDAILMTGFGTGRGDCRNNIAIGERWVFFVDGNPATDEVLHTSYVNMTYDAVAAADTDTLKAITAFTEQEPVRPYWSPFWTLVSYWTYSPAFKLGVLVGAPLAVIGGGLLLARFRKRRKTKPKNQA